ncbi:MAG TPA: TolC family protein [Burkholderiaceae bacterium]
MRRGLLRLLAAAAAALVGGLGSAGVARADAATPATLADLERSARGNAAAVRIADEEARLQQHRLDAAEAQRGARFGAGTALADTREPVTDTLVRDYRRSSAQVGVRWPLLDGAQAQDRARTDARGALEAARWRTRQAELDVLRAVRIAYSEHLRSAERVALAEALLQLEPGVAAMLAARTRQSLLLEADRRELVTIFEFARRDAVRARAQRDEALSRLRRLSALPDAMPALAPPRWDLACLSSSAPLLAAADQRPFVARAAAELATREALADQQQWAGVEGGVSLTQSLSRDIGGPSGRSTGVGIDVSVPFEWRALRDARRAEAESALRRARLELDAAREADAAAVDQAWREVQVLEADRVSAAQRLDAAREALRIAERRARDLDGDVLERAFKARHGLYVAAIDANDALQRLERAQSELLVYAEPCSAGAAAAIEPPQWQTLPALLAAPLVVASAGAAGAPNDAAASRTPGLGWFAWQGAPWLAEPARMLAELPPGSERVLLGFDAAQLQALATPGGAAALRALSAQAHARGVRIELLLGDPDWVTPAGRERLLALLRPLVDLPFDALNLDLERSSLRLRGRAASRQGRDDWSRGVVATVGAVHGLLRWPIVLTMHDRELLDARQNRRLQAAGASELLPMIYVADGERAIARLQAVMRAAPGLRVGIAQSVERSLEAASSLHRLGRGGALDHVADLAHAVATATPPRQALSRFGGVVIQSFEEFRNAAP